MAKDIKYQAFISYSHIDSGFSRLLQKMLERIGRPFFYFGKRRITVFRDETDLSLTPSLPDSILAAMEKADHFILMASEKAAVSNWVNEEVKWWLERKDPGAILIVIIHGELKWADNDFDWDRTNCLPRALTGCFSEEPLYLDWRSNNKNSKAGFFNRTKDTAPVIRLAARLLDKAPRQLARSEARTLSRVISILFFTVLSFFFLSYRLITSTQTIKDTVEQSALVAKARDSALTVARLRRMNLISDSISQAMSAAAVYKTAKLDTIALKWYIYAYQLASLPEFDTIAGFDSIRIECKRKMKECEPQTPNPHP